MLMNVGSGKIFQAVTAISPYPLSAAPIRLYAALILKCFS